MISVIIPTYNEKEVLEDCIQSLGEQTQNDFEIIVVDDGSIDNTGGVVKNLKSQIDSTTSCANLKFLTQSHKGPGAARNLGAKQAKGKILVFVDADMTFEENFLKNLVTPIVEGRAKGTFGKEEYVSNWDNIWARCWNINEGWEAKKRHPENYPDFQPVFRAILKSEFDKVGGFTPGGYDDDWSLYGKLGYEAINAPDAIFYHQNPSSLSEVFNHAKWVGKRKYKFGRLGMAIGLGRASFPVSLVIGLWKSTHSRTPAFLLFKLIYDFGISVGILELFVKGKGTK